MPADDEPSTPDQPDDKGSRNAKGIALLVAIFMTAMMMLFTTDMIVNSTVDLRLSAAGRDNVKAEYIAKSGMNLGLFLVTSDLALDLTLFEFQGGTYKPTDGPQDIWSLLNGYPIGGETIEMISTIQQGFNLSKVNDSKVLDKLELFDGQFVLEVEDEASRINVNYCALGRGDRCLSMLKELLNCPAEREYLERKRVEILELVGMIKDWADLKDRPEEGTLVGTEEDPYMGRDPEVKPKNAYYDTLDELKMVPGWDDDLHRIFSPYLTVYPKPGINEDAFDLYLNLNTADRALMNCLLPRAATECAEKAALRYNRPNEVANISSLNGIKQSLNETFCLADTKKIKYFAYRSDVYRLKVTGQVGDQFRKMETVVKRGIPDEIDQRNGFVGAYKYLYWKLL